MAIPNPSPVVIPPSDEQTFPHVWLKLVQIHAPSNTSPGSFRIEYCPYNSDTGQGLWNDVQVLSSDNLFGMIGDTQIAANAMTAIFSAFPHIKTWVDNNPMN
jgi:hypothetical protein